MRALDARAIAELGVPGPRLMENAGAGAARLIARELAPIRGKRVSILCGKGNNGGDGFVVARRLKERGVSPQVILFGEPSGVRGDAATSLKSWQQMGELRTVKSVSEWESLREDVAKSDLIVDA